MTGRQNRVAHIPSKGASLEIAVLEAPQPSKGEVLIRNYAVAIQPLDTKILLAGYEGAGSISSYPAVLGSSGAGVVEELGSEVTDLKVGDRVVFDTRAYVRGDVNRREGTWQQLVVCDARTVAQVCVTMLEKLRCFKLATDWRTRFRAGGTYRLSSANGSSCASHLSRDGKTRDGE
jgi:NADPH:quinone reductase-like Zn-dependent oxidoreductase